MRTPEQIAADVVRDEYGLGLDALQTLEAVMDAPDGQTAADLLDTVAKAARAAFLEGQRSMTGGGTTGLRAVDALRQRGPE